MKSKTEQNTERFAVKEKIDAKVIKKLAKDNLYELSVKDLEIQEEKKALKEYGSSSSGAIIGDIIGAASDEDNQKKKKKLDNEKMISCFNTLKKRKSKIIKFFISPPASISHNISNQ